jgi:hypothetical protein
MVLENEGCYLESQQVNDTAINGRGRLLGTEHGDTLWVMDNQAWVLARLGRTEEAERLCFETFKGREKTLGPDHPNTLRSMGVLAGIIASRETMNKTDELRHLIEAEKL